MYKCKESPILGLSFFAESEGFEPPVQRNVYTAFRVRLFRPLRQLSLFSFAKVLLFFDIDKYYAIFLQNSFLPPAFTLYTLPLQECRRQTLGIMQKSLTFL